MQRGRASLVAMATTMCFAACGSEAEVTGLNLDVGTCFTEALADPGCGETFAGHLSAETLACLTVAIPGGTPQVLTLGYEPQSGRLTIEQGGLDLMVKAKDLIELELFVLRATATTCPAFGANDSCPAHGSCLLSFGRQTVQVPDAAEVLVRYGGASGAGCGIECHDDCTPERCNGADDDCDGATDEGFPLGEPCEGMGECSEGTWECNAAGDDVRCDAAPGGSADASEPETCNGRDDDCDGESDEAADLEATREVAVPCGADEGACEPGELACEAGELVCIGAVVQAPESCNALDDDCDGETDEAEGLVEQDEIGGPCGTSAGECEPGAWTCVAGERVCEGGAGPTAEACNLEDDDCDGETDERADLAAAGEVGIGCGSSVGACRQGIVECVAGAPSCVGAVEPGPERCDGEDNDCDGETDEISDLTASGEVGGACGSDVGECAAGTWACQDAELRCVGGIGPAESDLCDELDNDCDALTDEDVPGLDAYGDVCQVPGSCAEGRMVCSGDRSSVCCSADPDCNPAIIPGREVCDGVDNDCDGAVDEEDDLLANGEIGFRCGSDEGACQRGVRVCEAGALVCFGGVEPSDELCDGVDNDCDEAIDETPDGTPLRRACYGADPATEGVGLCRGGEETCADGAWPGACDGQIVPVEESCDGQDNDCDTLVDEDDEGEPLARACYDDDPATLEVGLCRGGVETCLGGAWPGSCEGQVLPTEEVCDGDDNDCDGFTDEDALGPPLIRACYSGDPGTEDVGTCHGGVETCDNGAWAGICGGEVVPADEICDGDDNDCDTFTDEGADGEPLVRGCYSGDAATEDVGLCRGGTEACADGGWNGVCEGEVTPREEVCDGDDNDCDTFSDEDAQGDPLARPCYSGDAGTEGVGLCSGGFEGCTEGGWSGVCSGQVLPGLEACDGDDNDCDGFADEDAEGAPLERECYTGDPETQERGLCAAGVEACAGGEWSGACVGEVLPDEEVCDGDDNDCDGSADESGDGDPLTRSCYSGDPATLDIGLCRGGLESCTAGAWPGVCQGEVLPADEACDGDDNDCDGEADEDLDDMGACPLVGCPDGSEGTLVCGSEEGQAQSVCEPVVRIVDAADVACGSFGRGSPATYVEDGAVVDTATDDSPRFQYDSTTGRTHLLLEGQRRNILIDTATPDPSEWQTSTYLGDPTWLQPHADGAPDGGAYTELRVPGRGGGMIQRQPGAVVVGTTLTHSAWLRSDTGESILLDAPRVTWPLTDTWERLTATAAAGATTVSFFLWRRSADAEDTHLWGTQVEEGAFASSYIPRADADAPEQRRKDVFVVPANHLDPERGTWLAWLNPLYDAEAADEDVSFLLAGDAVSAGLLAGAQPVIACTTAGVTAQLPAAFGAGTWVFVACTWDAQTGVTLSVREADELVSAAEPTPFVAAAAPQEPFAVAPMWALSDDVRLYARALSQEEITALVLESVAEHRPVPAD